MSVIGSVSASLTLVKSIVQSIDRLRDLLRNFPRFQKLLEDVKTQFLDDELLLREVSVALNDTRDHRLDAQNRLLDSVVSSTRLWLDESQILIDNMVPLSISEPDKKDESKKGASASSPPNKAKSIRNCIRQMFRKTTAVATEAFSEKTFEDRLQKLVEYQGKITTSLFQLYPHLEEQPHNIAMQTDSFKPFFCEPPVQGCIVLDFNTCDTNEECITAEGRLKQKVLASKSGEYISACGSHNTEGAYGMGGVGKTIAMQALCKDDEVKKGFEDGICFLQLGNDVTDIMFLREILGCVHDFGGEEVAKEILDPSDPYSNVKTAVKEGAKWFEGRKVLIVCDDVWPSNDNEVGYLELVRQLIRRSPKSRLVFSTRSKTIANEAGASVKIESLRPQSDTARKIVFNWAFGVNHVQDDLDGIDEDEIEYLLTKCAGHQLALTIAGCTLKCDIQSCNGDIRSGIGLYVKSLRDGVVLLTGKKFQDYGGLANIFGPSLTRCEEWSKSEKVEDLSGHCVDIAGMLESLCVFRKQMLIPLRIVIRFWNVRKRDADDIMRKLEEYQLAKREKDDEDEFGLKLHDLIVDVCQELATKNRRSRKWHKQLLGGYVEVRNEGCRAWWEVKDDGYLHDNVSRHLVGAELVGELEVLLCDLRWIQECAKGKGWIGVENDFDLLIAAEQYNSTEGILQVRNVLELAWGYLDNERHFVFQVFANLGHEERKLRVVRMFTDKLEQLSDRPFLKPCRKYYEEKCNQGMLLETFETGISDMVVNWNTRMMMVAVGKKVLKLDMNKRRVVLTLYEDAEEVKCLAVSADGRVIVSGLGDGTLRRWNAETGESIGEAMRGHEDEVTCLAVSGDGKVIVSGSFDRTLRRWNAETGESIGEAMEGREGWVTCLAVSGDGKVIVSGSGDGTLQRWNAETGESIGEAMRGHEDEVRCLAVSGDGKVIVSGSEDGTFRR